ncbi:MAG TPA: hypothetical protein VGM09_14370, partial [Bradyrhizobium sp.]
AQISRRDVGTSVFSGMLVASSIGVFLIPMLYVVFQRWRERDFRSKRVRHRKFGAPHPAEPAGK